MAELNSWLVAKEYLDFLINYRKQLGNFMLLNTGEKSTLDENLGLKIVVYEKLSRTEILNIQAELSDIDGLLSNFFNFISASPKTTAANFDREENFDLEKTIIKSHES